MHLYYKHKLQKIYFCVE